MEWTFLFLCTCLCMQFVQNYNILAVFPLQSRSHYNMFERLLKELVRRGHEVDVVSHFPQETPIPGFNDLSLKGTVPSYLNNLTFPTIKDVNMLITLRDIVVSAGYELCEALFSTGTLQNLKSSTKKYDLFVTELFSTDCMLGFAHIFNAPIVQLVSSVNLPWGNDILGNPDNPAYIRNYFFPHAEAMSFWGRLLNAIMLLTSKISYDVVSLRNSNTAAKRFFGPAMPNLKILAQRTSLMLVNSHFTINQVRPVVPNFVEVAGLHITEPKELPAELESVVQASEKGVIYFSVGSMLLSETFHPEVLQEMFDALEELQYAVLWKATRERFPETLRIPNNIYFQPWMPQLDILCHPKTKLFISHGGLMGTQEAIYCGVPILGIPVFADQFLNVKQSVLMGIAKEIQHTTISKKPFLNSLRSLLEDPKYHRTATHISKKFRDRPKSPLQTAAFWIEYVIKYEGIPELRSSGADLPSYKYALLDVISIFLLFLCFVAFLLYFVFKSLLLK